MKVIGIAGYARCGKDTFVGIAKKVLRKNGFTPVRVAFADKLKEEVTEMLKANNFQASVYTEDAATKALIRPLLVWWGCQRRYESEGGLYWVNEANEKLRIHQGAAHHTYIPEDQLVALVSDVRFVNEANWIHQSWDGVVIHLKRYTTGKERKVLGGEWEDVKYYDAAPNEEEAKNDPLVQELADFRIEWESKKKMTAEEAMEDPYLQGVALDVLNQTKFFNGKLTL